jgi:hypothetical protein
MALAMQSISNGFDADPFVVRLQYKEKDEHLLMHDKVDRMIALLDADDNVRSCFCVRYHCQQNSSNI